MRGIARRWVLPFIDPRQVLSLTKMPSFLSEYRRYKKLESEMPVPLSETYPLLRDRVASTPFDAHYFFQAAWISRLLVEARPRLHVDIGSSVQVNAVLSAWVDTVFLDYRPLPAKLSKLMCVAGTATHLPFADYSLSSVSCLHVIEHIGLGRYGDPLDPTGSRSALRELARVVMPGGKLYVSVPVGKERVCFNAHRVFAPQRIAGWLDQLRLESFSYVNDSGEFVSSAQMREAETLEYGCGMFELVRADA